MDRSKTSRPADSVSRRWAGRAAADHWSFLFAQIAIYSFVVLLVTGVFLTLFFDPDMTQVTYDGSYTRLRGTEMSRAYASTLEISFDTRGGLLMRQMHHWAALIFTAAVCCQLLRMFFTGAFQRPRVMNWLIWVGMLTLAMAAGVTGTILPDDMLSGGSLSLIQGVTQSIPVVGTWLTFLIFGDGIPGDDVLVRLYWVHIIVLPLLMGAMFAYRHRLIGKHGHSRFTGGGRGSLPLKALGSARRAISVAMFAFTCGVLALLGTFAQINPVWLYGPFRPGDLTAGAVPGWYMGFLDGAVRIMPGWEIDIAGHPLTLAVLVPALIVPGAFFTVLAGYPWLERLGLRHGHRLRHPRGVRDPLDRPLRSLASRDSLERTPDTLERPRDHPVRTGIGAAGITFYGLLWAAAANDQIAHQFHLSLYSVTWFFRIAVLIGPGLAFVLTRWFSLYLTYREREESRHGYETGRIVMSPTGAFTEIHAPVRRDREPAVSAQPSRAISGPDS